MNLDFPIDSNVVAFTCVPTRLINVFEHKEVDGGDSTYKLLFQGNLVAEIYRGSVTFNNNIFCMYQLRAWKAEVIREVGDVYQGIIDSSNGWVWESESTLLVGVVAALGLVGVEPKNIDDVLESLSSMMDREGLIEIIEMMYTASGIWRETRGAFINFGRLGEESLNEDEAVLLACLFLKRSELDARSLLSAPNQSHLVTAFQRLPEAVCQKTINHLQCIWDDAVEEFEGDVFSVREIKSIQSVIESLRLLKDY
ncbi:hypothetical protein OTK49_21360 [Vibrio coralliirubri]|uniref:hypothetical protein n=1 Tax=Vibrio coralliirubri TaxID=1516159 RepID=UPI0022850186|nr:hypothetical protein [Vibrio coralliirubri]MCY9865070.1 hypothetical protein [Vibrio coralliirubri]